MGLTLQVMRVNGDKSSPHAGQRTDALLDAGDFSGIQTWSRIVVCVEALEEGAGSTRQ